MTKTVCIDSGFVPDGEKFVVAVPGQEIASFCPQIPEGIPDDHIRNVGKQIVLAKCTQVENELMIKDVRCPQSGSTYFFVVDKLVADNWKKSGLISSKLCNSVLPDYLTLCYEGNSWTVSQTAEFTSIRFGPIDGATVPENYAVPLMNARIKSGAENPKAILGVTGLSDDIIRFSEERSIPILSRIPADNEAPVNSPEVPWPSVATCDFRCDLLGVDQRISSELGLVSIVFACAFFLPLVFAGTTHIETSRIEVEAEKISAENWLVAKNKLDFDAPLLDFRSQVENRIQNLIDSQSDRDFVKSPIAQIVEIHPVLSDLGTLVTSVAYVEGRMLKVRILAPSFENVSIIKSRFRGIGIDTNISSSKKTQTSQIDAVLELSMLDRSAQ